MNHIKNKLMECLERKLETILFNAKHDNGTKLFDDKQETLRDKDVL
jgi:hypothetical protein